MSGAAKCNVCGVSGTSTYRCCGNNKDVRLKQIDKEIKKTKDKIVELKYLIIELVNERTELENEK